MIKVSPGDSGQKGEDGGAKAGAGERRREASDMGAGEGERRKGKWRH